MNKREMSAAISADYEAWLAGVKHRSALFDEPVKAKPVIPVTKKPTATIHKVAKKPSKVKRLKVYKRPPPDEPIIDAIRACLIKPLLKTEVVDIVSKRLGVNRRSVFNSIKTGFVFKQARMPARTATLMFVGEIPDSFVRQFEISVYKTHFSEIFKVGSGTIANFSRVLDRNYSQIREQLELLVGIGAMTKDGGIYREQI